MDEVALVDLRELATIEGLDESTAEELQNRAKGYLERRSAEMEEKRKSLGVRDELAQMDGLSPEMVVALGEAGIKTVEDLADCATDDLTGWNERKDGQTTKHKGAFTALGVAADEAEALIMQARVAMGWIEAPLVEEEVPVQEEAAS